MPLIDHPLWRKLAGGATLGVATVGSSPFVENPTTTIVSAGVVLLLAKFGRLLVFWVGRHLNRYLWAKGKISEDEFKKAQAKSLEVYLGISCLSGCFSKPQDVV